MGRNNYQSVNFPSDEFTLDAGLMEHLREQTLNRLFAEHQNGRYLEELGGRLDTSELETGLDRDMRAGSFDDAYERLNNSNLNFDQIRESIERVYWRIYDEYVIAVEQEDRHAIETVASIGRVHDELLQWVDAQTTGHGDLPDDTAMTTTDLDGLSSAANRALDAGKPLEARDRLREMVAIIKPLGIQGQVFIESPNFAKPVLSYLTVVRMAVEGMIDRHEFEKVIVLLRSMFEYNYFQTYDTEKIAVGLADYYCKARYEEGKTADLSTLEEILEEVGGILKAIRPYAHKHLSNVGSYYAKLNDRYVQLSRQAAVVSASKKETAGFSESKKRAEVIGLVTSLAADVGRAPTINGKEINVLHDYAGVDGYDAPQEESAYLWHAQVIEAIANNKKGEGFVRAQAILDRNRKDFGGDPSFIALEAVLHEKMAPRKPIITEERTFGGSPRELELLEKFRITTVITATNLKKEYLRLLGIFEPRVMSGEKIAIRRTKEITEAYEALTDTAMKITPPPPAFPLGDLPPRDGQGSSSQQGGEEKPNVDQPAAIVEFSPEAQLLAVLRRDSGTTGAIPDILKAQGLQLTEIDQGEVREFYSISPDRQVIKRQTRLPSGNTFKFYRIDASLDGGLNGIIVSVDTALVINGGIDFNGANLSLQIRRDGHGVPLPLAQQDMAQLNNIQGLDPEILEIQPAVNLPILSELRQQLQSSSV